jgi:hypothetical protein
MLGALTVITLVLLVYVIVSSVSLARTLSSNSKKDRELSALRDSRLMELVKQVKQDSYQAAKAAEIVQKEQSTLDVKIVSIVEACDVHSKNVNSYLDKIRSLVEIDITAARRNELSRTRELKTQLERFMSLTTVSRQSIPTSDMLMLESTRTRIEEIEAILGVDDSGNT